MGIKKVGNSWYVHRSNFQELLDATEPFLRKNMIHSLELADKEMVGLEVIKFDRHDFSISFIQSPDWFTAYEPVVGDGIKYNSASVLVGKTKGRETNKQIYHSKELFMADDYNSEWMEKAKARTELWHTILGIDKLKCKIGNQNFWFELLDANGIEKEVS